MVQKANASDASSGEKCCSRIVSDKGNDQVLENQSNTSGDESNRSRNECNDKSTSGDDTDIRPSCDTEPMVEVPYTTEYNMFVVNTQHYEQTECIINTCVVEKVNSNGIPDSSDMCDNEIQTNQNDVEYDDERVVLANLIVKLKLNIDENKKIQKQLKKANTSLTQELKECKSTLIETSRTLGESNSIRDSCLIILQNKQTEFERYKAFKPNIFKNISFLPVSKSISKIRQAYNVMTNNINHFRELVDQAWEKHSHNHFRAPTALDMEVLINMFDASCHKDIE
nr:hypothetical protein [Tanacetum cinerariifolium]